MLCKLFCNEHGILNVTVLNLKSNPLQVVGYCCLWALIVQTHFTKFISPVFVFAVVSVLLANDRNFLKYQNLSQIFFILIYVYVCMPLVCIHHMHVSINKSQKRASHSLELKLEVVVSQLMKVLETELGFSARAASAVNC